MAHSRPNAPVSKRSRSTPEGGRATSCLLVLRILPGTRYLRVTLVVACPRPPACVLSGYFGGWGLPLVLACPVYFLPHVLCGVGGPRSLPLVLSKGPLPVGVSSRLRVESLRLPKPGWAPTPQC